MPVWLMRILVTRVCKADIQRLHPNQKAAVDDAVRFIASNPKVGEAKVGDLAGDDPIAPSLQYVIH